MRNGKNRYGSSDLSISRVLQNRRFDWAMVAFLDCLRQLIEWVGERDRSVRVPHRLVFRKLLDTFFERKGGNESRRKRREGSERVLLMSSLLVMYSIVKDKIGDVSIKYQFGSDETWSRALRHVRSTLPLPLPLGALTQH